MERPKVIIHILSGLDGKIIGPFMGLPATRTASKEYGRIRGAYQADAWLYGTVTTREFTDWREPELEEGPFLALEEDFAAEASAPLYYVSIDPLGEVGWESGTFRKAGRPDSHVIEVLTEKAPAAYRAYLQRRGVSYILAGKDSLDCRTACEKLYRLFGIRTLLVCGGGTINWTFVQQGVADELSLLLAPAFSRFLRRPPPLPGSSASVPAAESGQSGDFLSGIPVSFPHRKGACPPGFWI